MRTLQNVARGLCLFFGDFNEILNPTEKMGGVFGVTTTYVLFGTMWTRANSKIWGIGVALLHGVEGKMLNLTSKNVWIGFLQILNGWTSTNPLTCVISPYISQTTLPSF